MGEQYIKVGIIPNLGGTQRLPRLVGLAKAKEMIFLGEMINAEEGIAAFHEKRDPRFRGK